MLTQIRRLRFLFSSDLTTRGAGSLPQTTEKEAMLNIYIPKTRFESRGSREKERQIASEIQAVLGRAAKRAPADPALVFDFGGQLLEDKTVPINDIYNKILKDFDLKFQLFQNRTLTQICVLDMYSQPPLNQAPHEVAAKIRGALESYLATLVRFGISVPQTRVCLNAGPNYINFVYSVFEHLFSRKLIYERESPFLYSAKLKREIHPNEYRLESPRTKQFLIKFEAKLDPTVLDLSELETGDGLPPIHALVTLKEKLDVVTTRAVWFHELVTYSIFEMGGSYFICGKDFISTDKFFMERKAKVIKNVTGAAFATSTFINPAYPTEALPALVTRAKDPGSGITGLSPSVHSHHLSLFLNHQLALENVLNPHNIVLRGIFKDENIEFIAKKVDSVLETEIWDSFFIMEPVPRNILPLSEERLFYRFRNHLYVHISSEIKEAAITNMKKVKRIGPSRDIGGVSVEDYLAHEPGDLRVTSDSGLGIPIPIVRIPKYRNKFHTSPDIIRKFGEYFGQRNPTAFSQAELTEILGNGASVRAYRKDPKVFDPGFLVAINFLYDFSKPDQLLEDGSQDQNPQVVSSSVENDGGEDGGATSDQAWTHLTQRASQFRGICENASRNQDIASSLVLQQLLTNGLSFPEIKTHSVLTDDQGQPLHTDARLISEPDPESNVAGLKGHGTEALRLLVAYTDLVQQPDVNVLLTSEMMTNKNAEVNLVRKIIWDTLRFIKEEDWGSPNDGLTSDSRISRSHLTPLDLGMLAMTDLLILQVTKAYEDKNYGRVYTLLVDFTKFYLYDLYLGARRSYLVNYHFTSEAQARRRLLARIVEALVIMWAPVLPLVSESAFRSLGNRGGMEGVFEAAWPKVSPSFNWKAKAQIDAIKNMETIRQLQKIALGYFAEEKGKVRDKQGIASKKKEVEGFEPGQMVILLASDRLSSHSHYLGDLEVLNSCLSLFEDELSEIFGCAEVNLLTKHTPTPPATQSTVVTQVTINGRTIPLRVMFIKVRGRKKCERCLKFTIKESDSRSVCEDCHRYVHPKYFEQEAGRPSSN